MRPEDKQWSSNGEEDWTSKSIDGNQDGRDDLVREITIETNKCCLPLNVWDAGLMTSSIEKEHRQ